METGRNLTSVVEAETNYTNFVEMKHALLEFKQF